MKNLIRTSAKVATKASKVLSSPFSSKIEKSIAASDLVNRKGHTPKKPKK